MPKVIFITPDEQKVEVEGQNGLSILEIAHKNNIPLEGACEGSLACSTCHGIIDEKHFSLLDSPKDDEEDMLDLAFGVSATSRLCCQITMTDDLDGIIIKIPKNTRNVTA